MFCWYTHLYFINKPMLRRSPVSQNVQYILDDENVYSYNKLASVVPGLTNNEPNEMRTYQ